MKNHTKAFIAGVLSLAFVGSAAAQVRVGIYASTAQPYYPQVVEARPQYVIPNQYYLESEEIYVEPSWQERREWRERRAWRRAARLQREAWLREQWRKEQWRKEHWCNEHGRYEQERRDWHDRD